MSGLRKAPRFFFTVVLACVAAGCGPYPRDIDGTTDRVQSSKTLRTGIVASTATGNERALARRIARAAGARAAFQEGSAEALLPRLEKGELDLVVGVFATSSPWKQRVTFTAPAGRAAEEVSDNVPVLRAAVRMGENRWLMFVGRAVRGGGAEREGS